MHWRIRTHINMLAPTALLPWYVGHEHIIGNCSSVSLHGGVRERGKGSYVYADVLPIFSSSQGHPTRRQKTMDVLMLAVSLGVLGAGAVSASR